MSAGARLLDVGARHRARPAYELAERQDAQLSHLFASGQLSMQLVHAVKRTTGLSLVETR